MKSSIILSLWKYMEKHLCLSAAAVILCVLAGSILLWNICVPHPPKTNRDSSADSRDFQEESRNPVLYDFNNSGIFQVPRGATKIANKIYYSNDEELGYIPDGITEINIPETVTEIGNNAFAYCEDLKIINLPDSVSKIHHSCFFKCFELTSIVTSNNPYYTAKDGVLFSSDMTKIIKYPAGKKDSSFTIPNSVTTIGESAFFDCRFLTNINISDSVEYVNRTAFVNCKSLTSINTSNNPYYTAKDGVLFSSDMTKIIMYPAGKEDAAYTIPSSVTKIGFGAFFESEYLTTVNIPSSVTCIEMSAFYGCISLENIFIPDTVTEIDAGAFSLCKNLKTLTLPISIPEIDRGLFYECTSLTSITIPNSVTKIGEYSFGNCKSLKNIDIPNSVGQIGNNAFSNCSSLTAIAIPDTVAKISRAAFYGCSSLTSVQIPGSVTEICKDSFSGCESLTDIRLPRSVKNGIDIDGVFRNCPNFKITWY